MPCSQVFSHCLEKSKSIGNLKKKKTKKTYGLKGCSSASVRLVF